MILIQELKAVHASTDTPRIPLKTDRFKLAKKRWRGYASDGEEFGFELDTPLCHGTEFYAGQEGVYVIEQKPERVLSITVPADPDRAAELGWKLGNLHVPVEVNSGSVWVADEPGMQQNLERLHLAFEIMEAVFCPLRAGHGHHDHSHEQHHEHHHHDGSCCGHHHD